MRNPRRRAGAGPVLLLALATAAVGTPAAAGAAATTQRAGVPPSASTAQAQCPTVLRVADVRAGMHGTGLTVTRGNVPEPFAVEVLGVLPNGIGPGRDLILVDVSDLPGRNVIGQGAGIWAGMSGSPVYIGGKLLGAVAFGFTAAPSTIGGVTPAEEMVKILAYPTRGTTAATRSAAAQVATRVKVPSALQARVTAATRAAGTTSARAAAATTLERLPLPLAVGGLSTQRMTRLQADVDAARLPVLAHASGTVGAPRPGAAMARPVAGGNSVAVLAYGDLTAGATGTITAVCGAKALSFGHPFAFRGFSSYGANDANSLAIVPDATFGAFKFATPTRPFGVVDQDRLAGIRTRLGVRPDTTPVVTSIRAVETRRSRQGRTEITDQAFLPELGFFAVLGTYDSVFDEIGDGSAQTAWSIAATRADGRRFWVKRANRFASPGDVSVGPAFDVAIALDELVNNSFEQVRIEDVHFSSNISTVLRQLSIEDLLVSVDGGAFQRRSQLEVRPGALLRARVVLRPFRSTATRRVELSLRVPSGAAGFGTLQVRGGGSSGGGGGNGGEGCFLDETGGCDDARGPASLDDVIKGIRSAPRNDDLILSLRLGGDEPGAAAVERSSSKRLDQVVRGARSVQVAVVAK